MKTKKLLAILLSLALLIGLVPAAGLLTTGVAAEETDPTVYEIDFTAGQKVDLGLYHAGGNYNSQIENEDGTTTYTTVYDVSFDYYLDCETEGALSLNYGSLSGGSSTLTKGLHSVNFQVTVTTDKNNAFAPNYTAASDCTLYAWNLVVKAAGTVVSHYYHGPWQCTLIYNGQSHDACNRTTASVTSDKTLADYNFEAMAIKVYEIAFKETDLVSLGYYRHVASDTTVSSTFRWNVTFEYYLNSETNEPFTFKWGNNVQTTTVTNGTGSTVLQSGRHTANFGVTTTCTGHHLLDPKFTAASGASGTLYVWNFKITVDGVDEPHFVHNPWQCSFKEHGDGKVDVDCGKTTATVTSDKTLADYPFCPNSDGSVKTKEVYVDQSFSDPTVYETVFTAGQKVDLGYYVASNNYTTTESNGTTTYTTVYDVSFDYYLDCETEGALNFSYMGLSGGSSTLTKGLHSVNFQVTRATTDKNNAFTPYYTAASNLAVDCTLYAWNLVVKANDKVISHYYHGPWQCTLIYNGQSHNACNRTTASVTSGAKLSTYSFAELGSQYYPYTTLYDAMQAIESSLYLEGGINIIGDYTAETALAMTADESWDYTTSEFTQWSTPVTIRGAVGKNTNHLYLTNGLYLYGATTFDDLTVNKAASDGAYTIRANHNEIVFGENAQIGGEMTLYGGVDVAQAPNGASAPHKITMNANTIGILYLGNFYNHISDNSSIAPSRRIPGVEYVQNSGTVTRLRIGAAGQDNYKSGNVYTGNVNITINGGSITKVEMDVTVDKLDAFTSFTNGAALQFIFNNGTTATVPDAKDVKALATDEETNPTSGDMYILKCAAGGSQLATTDEAGVYTVADPSWVAVATDTTDATKIYRSKDGTLTVPAGTYTVGWDVEDSANGYYFNFNSDNFDSSFMGSVKTYQNINLFYAKSFTTSATGKFRYSFDYYMPEQSDIYVSLANAGAPIMADETTGTGYLQQGRHTFSCTFDTADYDYSTATTLGFASYYDWYRDQIDGVDGKCYGESLLPGDLYVWNVRLTDLSNNVVKRTTYDGEYVGCGKNCVTEVNIDELDLDMQNNTSVYGLDFTECEEENPYAYIPLKQTMAAKTDATAVYQYIISFDYYLLGNAPVARARFGMEQFSNPDGTALLRNVAEGENNDYNFDVGRHTFKAVVTRDMFPTTTAPLLCFELDDDGSSDTAKLYVWNLQFYCSEGAVDSVKGNLLHSGLIVKSSETSNTVLTVTDVPTTELTPELQLDMHSAQYREDYSLRFVAAIKGASITRQDGGKALYDDTATITIGCIPYKVVGAGVLFGRDKRIAKIGAADEVLTLENVDAHPNDVYNIFAEKLQSDDCHAQYLGEDNEGVVYTGVIKSIPRANWDETLSARAYVTLKDASGKEQTVYGNVLSRSLMQVKPSKEPSSKYTHEQATAMKGDILSAANTEIPENAIVYYVSNNVSDETKPEGSIDNPFTTLDKVNALPDGTEQEPIVVLFERGCEWRGSIEARSYTTYGSYGLMEDPKPAILGSWMNYATLPVCERGDDVPDTGESVLYWQQLDAKFGNRWQLVGLGEYLKAKNPEARTETGANVGNVLFFDEYGMVNGSMSNSERIYQDYEFYHKVTTGTDANDETVVTELGDLYVYLPEGKTPANYTRIEIADDRMIINDTYDEESLESVTIDNLCLMYTGGHGISMVGTTEHPVKNITITNCEIGWIGGSKYKTSVRYGNGIQFFGSCDTVTVKNNWIYQCYDAGYTNQGNSGVAKDINVSENLIEYCAYSLELWMDAETGCIQDANYSNNLMRFAGYEFERDNRVIGAVSHVNFMFGEQPCKNVKISDNIFDTSYVSLIVVNHPNSKDDIDGREGIKKGPTITGNTWIQRYDRYSFLAYQRVLEETSEGAVALPANSLEDMKESVDKIDLQENGVIFIK